MALAMTAFVGAACARLTWQEPASALPDGAAIFKARYERPTEIPFPEDNPYTEAKARLGRTLYFDPRLSRSNTQSCASCHNPSFAWGDGLSRAVGDGMHELARRSPTILNAAWSDALMWDGRFETLEEQALGPIEAEVEMNMDLDILVAKLSRIEEYRRLFAEVFGGDATISARRIAMAIATYERTVVSGEAPFDRWVGGDDDAISGAAERGFRLFNDKARCAACHSGWRFTDDSFHDIGLAGDDPGRGRQLPDVRAMQHAFKTPGLRNIDRRAPYMHDGSLPTLETVIEHYDGGGIQRPSLSPEMRPLQLTGQDKQDLVAFLRTLTSNDPPVEYMALPR